MLKITSLNDKVEFIIKNYGIEKLDQILGLFCVDKKKSYFRLVNSFLLHHVSIATNVSERDIYESGNYEPCDARCIVIYLLNKEADIEMKEIIKQYKRSRFTVRNIINRVVSIRNNKSNHKRMNAIIDDLSRHLKDYIEQIKEIENLDTKI